MKSVAIIVFLLSVNLTFTFGQNSADSISIKKKSGGYQFYQGKQRLKMNEVVKAMEPNGLAYTQIKSAKSTATLANIVGGVGGFLVGWPIGAAVAGGKPNWKMAGVGAGLIVVSIPISHSANKKTKQAVETYNGGLPTSSFWDKHELRLSLTENGVGLGFNFYTSHR